MYLCVVAHALSCAQSRRRDRVKTDADGDAVSTVNGRQGTVEKNVSPSATPWRAAASCAGTLSREVNLRARAPQHERRVFSQCAAVGVLVASQAWGRAPAQQHDTDDDGFVSLAIFPQLVAKRFMRTHYQNILGSLPSCVADHAIFRPPLESATFPAVPLLRPRATVPPCSATVNLHRFGIEEVAASAKPEVVDTGCAALGFKG